MLLSIRCALNLTPTNMSHRLKLSAVTPLLLCAFTFLPGCGGDSKPASSSDSAAAVVAVVEPVANKGETTYGQICASCHQATGVGVEGTYPPLKNSRWLTGDPSVPISIVIAGMQGEITVDGKVYNGAMQPWGMLSDDDVANVLTYARSQWGNTASPVTATQVKTIREKMGNRGTWTADELKKTYPGAGA